MALFISYQQSGKFKPKVMAPPSPQPARKAMIFEPLWSVGGRSGGGL
jgi:hypothetical protein